jgi:hypothetical protein
MSLVEVMVAASVFLIGLLGLAGAFSTARTSTGAARRQVWASRIAQDLAAQADLWEYADRRLTPASREDPADVALALEGPDRDEALGEYRTRCHTEALLACDGGCSFGGIPGSDLADGFGSESATGFERFWCVDAEQDDGSPATVDVNDVRKRVTVVVSYLEGGRPRRYVTHHVRFNPRFRAR